MTWPIISRYRELDEELGHASDMSHEGDVGTFSNHGNPDYGVRESSVSESSVRIEIRDVDIEGSNNLTCTTSTLRKCKKEVLRPYWNLLIFIGWRGFNRESIFAHGLRWRVLNVLYTAVVVGLLMYSYGYEVMACEWRLDLNSDLEPLTPSRPAQVAQTTKTPDLTSLNLTIELGQSPSVAADVVILAGPQNLTTSEWKRRMRFARNNPACEHIVTTYLIPGLLHFISYILGFYYFRIQENEQLDALMEKVFLQATSVQARTASHKKMIRTQWQLLFYGGLWVFLSAMLQCFYIWTFDMPCLPLFHDLHMGTEIMLFAFGVAGRTVFNSVILAIVVNFVTQCEMLKFYVKGLVMRLQEKSTDLKTAMKDVLTLRQSLTQLNGLISKMTSLAGVILAELTAIGVFLLLLNQNDKPKVWAYRTLFPVVWAMMLALPLYQAARVNSICLRIQKVSLEMRVFGYKGASLLDLDSFLTFVNLTKLRAKLFHITMVPSQLIFTGIVIAFVLLVLLQTSVIGPPNQII